MQARTVYLSKRVETEVTVHMAKALNNFDITPLQFAIMSFVDTDTTNFSSSQLSRRFSMTPQSMNETVGILQRKNLIIKSIDPQHKRVLRLSLTDKGKAILTEANKGVDMVEQKLFDCLTPDELHIYRSLMGKILIAARNNSDS
jgi:DNA-binding MarR family transcriptional regulator